MAARSEEQRMNEFARVNPLATASEASFDIITRLVQQVIGAPAVAITLIDQDTQYLRARQGIDLSKAPRSAAICDIIVCSGEPLIIGDMQKDRRVSQHPCVTGPMGLRAYAGAPLTTNGGQQLGALCVLDTSPRNFSPEQVNQLTSFAALISDQFELRAQADIDFLTNTLNRRGFQTVLQREMGLIASGGAPATLAMLDLDYFKSVNDTYGHPVGDLVLKTLATLFTRNLRSVDYVARMGGEEFALLLPDTPLDAGVEIVNRLRKSVANCRLEKYPDLSLTVSIGLVDITSDDNNAAALIRDVDAALYMAKASGRNQTITFPRGHEMRTQQIQRRRS